MRRRVPAPVNPTLDHAARGGEMMGCANLNRVIMELWPQADATGGGVWAILDAASDERIVGAIENARLDHCCLFTGRLDPELRNAAPYLVKLRFGHELTEYIVAEGWGHHWGVFLQADISMEELRLHLKQFLSVKEEDGQRLFFRFYDPRVLRVYLPSCTAHELRIFYGPILRYVMEGEEPANLIEFALRERELKVRKVELSPEEKSWSAASC
jgi:hypothetical protein